MSTQMVDTPEYEPDTTFRVRSTRDRVLLWSGVALLVLFVLAIVEQISGASELLSEGTWGATIRLAVPIMLAGLGGLFSERSGVVNIGLEGMMIAGAWFGAWAGWMYGPWQGVALGIVGGMMFGLIHAIATVTFAVDQIVSGVAIIILAGGVTRFLSVVSYDPSTGGGATQSPRVQALIPTFDVPWVSSFFGDISDRGWFYVSDLAAFIAGVTTRISWLTLIALLVVPAAWFILWRTPWGLRLRSCGENPWAAESLGVPVLRMKYWGVVISGGLAGLGGAYLVVVQAGIYREGMVAGRGFIGLAALIFGNWYPFGVLTGSTLFGYSDALSLRSQPEAVHALLLAFAIALFVYAAYQGWRGAWRTSVVLAVIGIGFLAWYLATDSVPQQFVAALPYLVTLFVLALATQRLRMPAADGVRYRKGSAL
jgi:general nucleoside transport system permease protein